MKKKTVLVITGSRAEYGLLRPVMREIMKSKKLTLQVLVTGSHTLKRQGHTIDLIREDKMPVANVVTVAERDAMTTALAKEIKGIGDYCRVERPDLILVNGDRGESFAGAIVGGHLGIPVAHIHGGDKTGWVVDEYIRHATTKFSHLHFAATKESAHRIQLLGEEPWRVFTVGGPGLDEMRTLDFKSKEIIAEKYGLSASEPWTLMLHHPTSLDPVSYRDQIRPVLRAVASLPGEKIVAYPNADTGSDVFIKEIMAYDHRPGMHIFVNVPREDYLNLFKYASVLVGNSSMGIIDSSFFRAAAVNVGSRQAGRERGSNVIDAGYDESDIRRAILHATSSEFRRKVIRSRSPYGDGHAAAKIVRAIEKNIDRPDLFHKKLTYV